MPTKDAHIALIDAHEKLEQIKLFVRAAVELVKSKPALTEDDRLKIKAIHAEAVERTKRIQDDLLTEIESHGKLS